LQEITIMKRSAMRAYAAAGAVSVTAGLMAVTPALLPGPTTTDLQTREVRLTSGDADLIAPLDGTELSQVDVASLAGAAQADGYSFTDLLTSIQNTVGAGDGWFSSASTSFAEGEYPLALSEELAGFNDLTVGVDSDLLANGYAFLTGSDGNAGFVLENPGQPADLAATLNEFNEFLGQAQSSFTDALTAFGTGDEYFGLVDLSEVGINSTYATDAIILGLFDVLTGAAVTA
jgi:hypothetical protein